METVFYLLVLVPHRDARLPLRAWGASLFAADQPGVCPFPCVAPLARLKRPLLSEELKILARAMRGEASPPAPAQRASAPPLCGGHPRNAPVLQSPLSAVWGPALNLALPDGFFAPAADAVDCPISPIVLGAALAQGPLPAALPEAPKVSFRAAALANMECRFRPCDGGDLFEWGIGPLQWLPKRVNGEKL